MALARKHLIVIAAAGLIYALVFGARQSLALFIGPLNTATGLGLAAISLAFAWAQLMWGVTQPIAGAMADKFGAARVIAVGGVLVCVGTILTPLQVNEVLEAGASFGVAPGMNPRVVAEAKRVGLPFAPGICTPTDIELAIEQGCRLLKFFPSEPSGGLAYLRTIAAPFAHLGVKYIPLGGVTAANADLYLKEPSVQALGGSWLAPRDVIKNKDWQTITANAREASNIVNRLRGSIS